MKADTIINKHIVAIADMKISTHADDEIITYSLGSCLGISAYDSQNGIGGLLHVMLPMAAGRHKDTRHENPFMYVDTGVPKFLNAVMRLGAARDNLEIKVAGGASMHTVDGKDNMFEIGRRNFLVLRKLLWKNGLLMKNHDIGGHAPRTMSLNVGTGITTIRSNGITTEL